MVLPQPRHDTLAEAGSLMHEKTQIALAKVNRTQTASCVSSGEE